jgi:hypothetical protein
MKRWVEYRFYLLLCSGEVYIYIYIFIIRIKVSFFWFEQHIEKKLLIEDFLKELIKFRLNFEKWEKYTLQ